MTVLPILYVIDKSKFYDRQRKGALLSLEAAKLRLQAYDSKYHDPRALEQTIRDIMDSPVTYDDIKESAKKTGPSEADIWNELRHLIRLKKQINPSGQSQVYYVAENNEVVKIDYVEDQSLIDALMLRTEEFAALRNFYNTNPLTEQIRTKLGFLSFLKRMLAENWHADERTLFTEPVQNISWDTETYAYKQMDSSLLKPGPTPTWDEFTSRLDYAGVFMAWVWGIFEPTNNIRQVMWLKGAGNDGKSSVQKAIESVIGKNYCYSMKPGDEQQQWFQRNVFGKVLVNYADCRNQFLIDSNSIKQLTGGDTTSIEGKGENSFTGKIYSKLLVTSNYLPRINPELQAHTSRLIKIEVQPQDDTKKDAAFEHRLQKEIYAFLYKCKKYFDELVSAGGERLNLPSELVDRIKIECASETYLNIQDFAEEYLEFGPEFYCKPADIRKVSKEFFVLEKRIPGDQLKHHEAELNVKLHIMGCAQIRQVLEDKPVTVWRGFRLKKTSSKLALD